MRKIVFDIETKNTFADVGSREASALDISIVGIHDSKDDKLTSFAEDEFDKLWPILDDADILIGYNSNHFDIPLLDKYYPGDLTKIKSIDLLAEIYDNLGRRIKLDDVAHATLGAKKSAHGLQAVEWWNSGEIDKIRKYCLDDVAITRDVYIYALDNKELKYTRNGDIRVVKLDPSNWEEIEEDEPETLSLF